MKKFYAFLLLALVLCLSVSCGGSKNEIRFAVRSGVVSAALTDLIAEFYEEDILAEYGLDYTFKIDAISGSYGDLKTSIAYDIAAQNAPGLIIGYPDHFAEYFNGGALINLQKYIDDPKYGYTAEEMKDFVDSYLAENRGYNHILPDALYGLPFNKSTEVLVYNKTAFEALFGENYLAKVPTTWAEVESVSNEIITLIAAGKLDETFVESVKVDADGNEEKVYLKVSNYLTDTKKPFYPFGYDSSDNAFITLLRQFGGKYTERAQINKGYTLFNLEENIGTTKEMLSYFRTMAEKGIFANATTFNESYCSTPFAEIRCLMTVGSSAGVGYNDASNSAYEYELGMAPIPYYDGVAEPVKYVIQQGTNVAILDQGDENKELACWLLIKFLLEPENTAKFAMATGGYLPVRQSAYDTEEYKKFLTEPDENNVHFSSVANTALNYLNNGYTFFVDDAFVGSAKIREEVGSVFDSVVVVGENADTRIQKAIDTLGGAFIKK